MRRTSILAAAVLLLLLPITQVARAQAAAQETPESIAAQYKLAMQAKDWPSAATAAQKLVDLEPTAENLRLLGDAQLNSGAMEQAMATYDRALAAAEQEKPAQGAPDAAWKERAGKIYVGKGNALLKLRRNAEAVAEYNHGVEISGNPTGYFNICAVLYNTGDTENALPACRKAVQADPARANGWFVLGSLIFANSKTDAAGNFVVPAEGRQALEKYLELAPDGPHAADVKAMLNMAAKP